MIRKKKNKKRRNDCKCRESAERLEPQKKVILGTFAKFRKAIISFIMSVCPSVRMEQLGSQWMDFHEVSYLSIFRKYVEKIQVSLKSDMDKGYVVGSKRFHPDIQKPRQMENAVRDI